MINLVIFIESHVAGGLDQIVYSLIQNLNVNHIKFVHNKDVNPKILFQKELPSKVTSKSYYIPTSYNLREWSQKIASFLKIGSFYKIIFALSLLLIYPWIYLYSYVYLYFFIKKCNPTHLLVCNGGHPGATLSRIAIISSFFLPKSKKIYSFHSIPMPYFTLTKPIQKFEDRLIDSSSIALGVSQNICNSLVKLRSFKQAPRFIYNGIASINTSHKKTETNRLKILHVGYFDDNKNQPLLVEAFAQLQNDGYSDIELTLIGEILDQNIYNKVKDILKKYNCEGKVNLLPFTNDIQNLYNSHDLFILPSKVEGFGLVLLEAMRSRIPVIGSSIGGIPEIISPGVNGYIFDLNEPEELKSYILKFYQNPKLIQSMGQASYEIFKEKFSLQKMLNQYEDLFT